MASLGSNLAAAIAFNRFGFGGRPDDVIPAAPLAWLSGQINGPDPYNGAGMPTTADGLILLQQYQNAQGSISQHQAVATQIWQNFDSEVMAFLINALTTRAPFRERLVWFWSNHFALMSNCSAVASVAGPYVREAIRPYVNGTFKDMLLAVMQHPGMLYSLNNTTSVGPQSPSANGCNGTNCVKLGINENLGRECLELHTVGVNAGYSQADVDAMAMLLTGWTTNLTTAPRGFRFDPYLHQPTAQTLMGQNFPGTQAGGIAALTYLATHPATYNHLATKLVTHFVSDTPSPGDIAIVANALSTTGGNLAAASNAVINLANAWLPYSKIRSPLDYVIAVLRATGATGFGTLGTATDPRRNVRALDQPTWQPPFPNGFSDLAADWVGPGPMMLRADWINALCNMNSTLDPSAIAANSLGPLLRPATVAAVNAATSNHDKLAVLFCSPEFQRR